MIKGLKKCLFDVTIVVREITRRIFERNKIFLSIINVTNEILKDIKEDVNKKVKIIKMPT